MNRNPEKKKNDDIQSVQQRHGVTHEMTENVHRA